MKKNKMKRIEKENAKEGRVDYSDEMKRLNRVIGQVEGVRKMMDEQRELHEILAQCKAVHSALRSIENRLLRLHLEDVLDAVVKLDKKKSREQKIETIEELFKQAS